MACVLEGATLAELLREGLSEELTSDQIIEE